MKNSTQFFKQLLDRLNAKIDIYRDKPRVATDSTKFWGATAGKPHMAWNCFSDCVELRSYNGNINNKRPEINRNKLRFCALEAKKEEIEKAFGEKLEWDYVEGRTFQRIVSKTPIKGIEDETNWAEIQKDIVDRLIRLEVALRRHIDVLD